MGYFSGQGRVKVAPIINDVVGAYRWVGNVPDFKPAFATSKFEHKESYTGQRLPDKVITTENKATVSATLEDWSKENLALAVRGNVKELASAAVTGDTSPLLMVVGDVWTLKNPNVSALTIVDSSTTPVTVDAADYTLDAAYGTVTINDLAGYTLPLKANYTKGIVSVVPFFTMPVSEVAIRFEGVNTADGNKRVLVELYKVALDPTKELGLITEQFGQFVLEGTALIDPTKPLNEADPEWGQFGRLVYLDE